MPSILTVNARGGMGPTSHRDYFHMTTAQFGEYIRAHHSTLVAELAARGISYETLSPALVPTTGDRHEAALLFNTDFISTGWYGRAVAKILIPLLNRESTLSVLAGDIGLHPLKTKELAQDAGLVPSSTAEWGQQFVYCVYLNNLTSGEREDTHAAFSSERSYLGYVPTTYGSRFRTIVGTMLPIAFLKHKHYVLVDHGGDDPWLSNWNEIGFPFSESNYEVVSVNWQLYSPLLSYKIQSEVQPMYEEDVMVSLNAISEAPLELDGFDVLLPEAKFGYLRTHKGEILKIAGLDELSRKGLAAVIRAKLSNDYIYRLQHNPDDTVQFSLVLELPRENSRVVKVAVGLKYFPESKKLSLVTLT